MTLGRQSCCKQCVIDWKANNKKAVAKSQKKSGKKKRLKYPEKEKARHVLNYAIRTGRLTKSKYCESCFTEGYVEAHHEDYSKPLDVDWLCIKCHLGIYSKKTVCC